MTATKTHDENGYEIEIQTDAQKAEIERVKQSGDRLNYSSAGATRRKPR